MAKAFPTGILADGSDLAATLTVNFGMVTKLINSAKVACIDVADEYPQITGYDLTPGVAAATTVSFIATDCAGAAGVGDFSPLSYHTVYPLRDGAGSGRFCRKPAGSDFAGVRGGYDLFPLDALVYLQSGGYRHLPGGCAAGGQPDLAPAGLDAEIGGENT